MPKSIAFFDSGIGGLTVLKTALKTLPGENFIYFGDSDNAPYGTKEVAEIRELVLHAADFLAQFDLKALVLACNTATSVAVQILRETYPFPIIGMEPALKPAVEKEGAGTVVVCATDLTLRENKLSNLVQRLKAEKQVKLISLQELVRFAENFEFQDPAAEAYIRQQFEPVKWNRISAVVLGCTHFIYYKSILRKLIPPHVKILDGNEGTVKHLVSLIEPEKGTGSRRYFISGREQEPAVFEKYFEML